MPNNISQEDADWINAKLEEVPDTDDDFGLDLTLSSDGKHTVILRTTGKAQRKAGLIYAQKLYDRVIEKYGTKQESAVKAYQKADKVSSEFICPQDGMPYEEKEGRFGTFWSHYAGKDANGKAIYHTKKDAK